MRSQNELLTGEDKMQDLLQGVWPAVITPIDNNGNPNLVELEKLIELYISQGLDGLYILGSTGQGILLKEETRKRVAEAVISVVQERLPVVVQVGSLTTAESSRLATHATQAGAFGISSVGPIYYSSKNGSSDMAIKHYQGIASATDLPFFPYQLGPGSYTESLESFVEKLLMIPNVVGMKLTTLDLLEISRIYSASRGKLRLFSGADELLCHAVLSGASGAIGTMYNLWGKECQTVRKEFVNGNVELGRSFMLEFEKVIEAILPNIWTFLRTGMLCRYGIEIGTPVPPLGNNNQQWSEDNVMEIVHRVIDASKTVTPTE